VVGPESGGLDVDHGEGYTKHCPDPTPGVRADGGDRQAVKACDCRARTPIGAATVYPAR
jgi:hypothetical protein